MNIAQAKIAVEFAKRDNSLVENHILHGVPIVIEHEIRQLSWLNGELEKADFEEFKDDILDIRKEIKELKDILKIYKKEG